MKTKLVVFALCCAALPSFAQNSPVVAGSTSGALQAPTLPAPTSFTVVERGGNHRVWERLDYDMTPRGIVARPHRFTELGTGMHFKRDGQWIETSEEIKPLPGGQGAAALDGPHQLHLPADLYDGVIEVTASDGNQLF
jgi:hypothetical protein